MFRVLRDEWGEDFDSFMSKKVIVIPGDVSLENLGLKDEDLKNEMLKEIEVLVNFAASTKFDERYPKIINFYAFTLPFSFISIIPLFFLCY